MKKVTFLANRAGFTGIEILIVVAALTFISGGVAYFFKDIFKDASDNNPPEPQVEVVAPPVKNPFPLPPPPPTQLPVEPVMSDSRSGEPILPKVTIAGEWHGRYDVTAPSECAGESGGWQATLSEKNGVISGNFSTDTGLSGGVEGTFGGGKADWNVGGGGSGVGFKGGVSGNTMSGTFTGLTCNKNPGKERSTGEFFGGREVQ